MERLELELSSGTARFKNAKVLRDTLEDPQKLLKKIGVIILASSQRAFQEQRLGSFLWKPRYPNQKAPKVNIAGALALLNEGNIPRQGSVIFQDRPALKGQSQSLRKSLAKNNAEAMTMVGPFTIEVGSNLPYADNMQFGIKSSQPVTNTAKKTLAKWMKKLRKKRRTLADYDPASKSWVPKGTGPKKKRKRKKKKPERIKAGRVGTAKRLPRWRHPEEVAAAGKARMPKESLSGESRKAFRQVSNQINITNKLAFLFGKNTLITTPIARPFIGITKEVAADIQETVEKALTSGRR